MHAAPGASARLRARAALRREAPGCVHGLTLYLVAIVRASNQRRTDSEVALVKGGT